MLKITLIVIIIIINYRTNIFRITIVVYIKFNISLRYWLDLSIKKKKDIKIKCKKWKLKVESWKKKSRRGVGTSMWLELN